MLSVSQGVVVLELELELTGVLEVWLVVLGVIVELELKIELVELLGVKVLDVVAVEL